MAHGGSRKVVILALFANLGIALAKLVAALVTGSGSMLAEAIHSFADAGNQALLLLGSARAARPADARHPLGYGREAYFWALIVAVLLFSMGGLFSAYEGVHKLTHPEPITSPGWAIGVLLVAVVLEGISLKAAWDECTRVRAGQPLFEWARTTGHVDLLVVTFEDLAAMAGLLIALAAVSITAVTGNPFWDATGSCVLAALLLLVAVFLGAQVRRLIVGFAAGPQVQARIRAIWEEQGFDVLHLIAVWSGPEKVMVALKIASRDGGGTAATLVERVNAAERAARAALPEIAWLFVEPDFEP